MSNLSWLIIGSQSLGPYEYYFKGALEKLGHEVDYMNTQILETQFRKSYNRISKFVRYNFYLDRALGAVYKRINDVVYETYVQKKYDVVFIYNDGYVFPDTLRRMKKHGAKIILFLCDDPMFIGVRHWFFQDVLEADIVLAHDVEWTHWIRMMGQEHVYHIVGASAHHVFHPVEVTERDRAEFGADVLFVGRNYGLNADGLYRGGLLNALHDHDIKIFSSSGWKGLRDVYPEIQQKILPRSLSLEELNTAHSAARIVLALSNWGVRSGVFTRILDTAMSGGFVLAEYRSGVDKAFPDGLITQFRSIAEMRELIAYYLAHVEERLALAARARAYTLEHYTIDKLAEFVISTVTR